MLWGASAGNTVTVLSSACVAHFDVHRHPRVGGFVLCDAVGVGPGVTEGGLVGLAGNSAAQVDQRQLDGAAYGGVGPPSRPETVVAAVYVELLDSRAVDDEQRRVDAGGAHDAAQVESLVHHGLQGGDDHGHVIGDAAGHYGVDSDALHRGTSAEGRQFGDELVGVAASVGHESAHQVLGGRHDGQAVRPAGLEHQLDGVGKFG